MIGSPLLNGSLCLLYANVAVGASLSLGFWEVLGHSEEKIKHFVN